MGYLNKFDRNS